MPIFRKGNRSLLFAHVPKSGGTSIEDLFAASGWQVGFLDRGAAGSLNPNRKCSPQHMHATLLEDRLRLETFELIFMVVRDPLARFRSEILMRLPAMDTPWSPEASEFTRNTLRRYSSNRYIHDNHIRPQTEFYLPGSAVFRLEDGLESFVETLRSLYDVELNDRIPHETSRRGTMASSAVEVPVHLRDRLVEFYDADYSRFGYERPSGS